MFDLIANMPIMLLLKTVMNLLDIIGVGIIIIGVIHAFVRYGSTIMNKASLTGIDQMRLDLGRYIVLSVEFLLAADIIKTIIAPNFYDIGMLGALVIIRTILTYFLNQELAQLQNVH